MADVILKEWSEAGGVTLPEIEQAIAETGLPRATVRLRLSLDFENVYEDDDNPEPVLQLVRDETDEERATREHLQQGLAKRAAVWDEQFHRQMVISASRDGLAL